MRKRPRLTRARLCELLRYDQNTGEFSWVIPLYQAKACGAKAGSIAEGYSRIRLDGESYRAHHLAWFYMTGRWPRPMIDHRDGNRANNRWSNLRLATQSENSANRRRHMNNTSGFKGVSLCPSGKWRAYVTRNNRKIYLGRYATPQAAHAAYVAAARKLFGEFARSE